MSKIYEMVIQSEGETRVFHLININDVVLPDFDSEAEQENLVEMQEFTFTSDDGSFSSLKPWEVLHTTATSIKDAARALKATGNPMQYMAIVYG